MPKKNKMTQLQDLVALISLVLDIKPPKIIDASRFRQKIEGVSETTLAVLSPDGEEMYLFKTHDIWDSYFAVAHELRHAWQLKFAPKMFNEYLQPGKLDKEAYVLQPAELDANAFATFVMIDLFSRKPLFYGLSEEIKNKIYQKADEIAAEIKRNCEND